MRLRYIKDIHYFYGAPDNIADIIVANIDKGRACSKRDSNEIAKAIIENKQWEQERLESPDYYG